MKLTTFSAVVGVPPSTSASEPSASSSTSASSSKHSLGDSHQSERSKRSRQDRINLTEVADKTFEALSEWAAKAKDDEESSLFSVHQLLGRRVLTLPVNIADISLVSAQLLTVLAAKVDGIDVIISDAAWNAGSITESPKGRDLIRGIVRAINAKALPKSWGAVVTPTNIGYYEVAYKQLELATLYPYKGKLGRPPLDFVHPSICGRLGQPRASKPLWAELSASLGKEFGEKIVKAIRSLLSTWCEQSRFSPTEALDANKIPWSRIIRDIKRRKTIQKGNPKKGTPKKEVVLDPWKPSGHPLAFPWEKKYVRSRYETAWDVPEIAKAEYDQLAGHTAFMNFFEWERRMTLTYKKLYDASRAPSARLTGRFKLARAIMADAGWCKKDATMTNEWVLNFKKRALQTEEGRQAFRNVLTPAWIFSNQDRLALKSGRLNSDADEGLRSIKATVATASWYLGDEMPSDESEIIAPKNFWDALKIEDDLDIDEHGPPGKGSPVQT